MSTKKGVSAAKQSIRQHAIFGPQTNQRASGSGQRRTLVGKAVFIPLLIAAIGAGQIVPAQAVDNDLRRQEAEERKAIDDARAKRAAEGKARHDAIAAAANAELAAGTNQAEQDRALWAPHVSFCGQSIVWSERELVCEGRFASVATTRQSLSAADKLNGYLAKGQSSLEMEAYRCRKTGGDWSDWNNHKRFSVEYSIRSPNNLVSKIRDWSTLARPPACSALSSDSIRQEEQQGAAASAAEQVARDAATIGAAQAQWVGLIGTRVRKFWSRPLASTEKITCTVEAKLNPDASVLAARVVRSCGSAALDRSVEQAVLKASPLPPPPDPSAMPPDGTVRITFCSAAGC